MQYFVTFQLSYTSGVLSVAKSAASVLWNYYVKEPEICEENTNIQTASCDLCISLQRYFSLFWIRLDFFCSCAQSAFLPDRWLQGGAQRPFPNSGWLVARAHILTTVCILPSFVQGQRPQNNNKDIKQRTLPGFMTISLYK